MNAIIPTTAKAISSRWVPSLLLHPGRQAIHRRPQESHCVTPRKAAAEHGVLTPPQPGPGGEHRTQPGPATRWLPLPLPSQVIVDDDRHPNNDQPHTEKQDQSGERGEATEKESTTATITRVTPRTSTDRSHLNPPRPPMGAPRSLTASSTARHPRRVHPIRGRSPDRQAREVEKLRRQRFARCCWGAPASRRQADSSWPARALPRTLGASHTVMGYPAVSMVMRTRTSPTPHLDPANTSRCLVFPRLPPRRTQAPPSRPGPTPNREPGRPSPQRRGPA